MLRANDGRFGIAAQSKPKGTHMMLGQSGTSVHDSVPSRYWHEFRLFGTTLGNLAQRFFLGFEGFAFRSENVAFSILQL